MTLEETVQAGWPILTEGAMVERIRRHPDVDLDPEIAHAGLIYDDAGRRVLAGIYRQYLDIGHRYDLPMLTLAPSWRANPERIARAGIGRSVETINGDCVRFLKKIRDSYGDYGRNIFVAGMLACRGNAYDPSEALGSKEAERFHSQQAGALADGGVDFIKAATLPAVSEAIGIARAIDKTGVPAVLSFVIRLDGTVLDGTPLHRAVEKVDAAVSKAPAFFMVNCVHPSIFMNAMEMAAKQSGNVTRRVLGFQANTSAKSPEELEKLDYLDTTEPAPFAEMMLEIHRKFGTRVLGGCCGTDERHVRKIAARLAGV